MQTKHEKAKSRFLEIFAELLNNYEEDIESGIEDGTYEEEDNVESRAMIKEGNELLEYFKTYQPSIYGYIQGGNLQGISVSETMDADFFDQDNYDAAPREYLRTPKQWDKDIKKKTKAKEIKPLLY